MSSGLDVSWLGRRDYDETTSLQADLVEKRRLGEIGDTLLILGHPPTYTCGRRTQPGDLPQSREWYRERGIEVFDTPRGGQVTYHGPGQLVIYPIVDLTTVGDQPAGAERADVAGFVGALESAMVRTLGRAHVSAGTIEGLTGVWASASSDIPAGATESSMAGEVANGQVAKIGSIGLRISRGISSHGLSLNVTCDLAPFETITACGIESCRVTSILDMAGDSPSVREVGTIVAGELAGVLGRDMRTVEPHEIGISPAPVPTA